MELILQLLPLTFIITVLIKLTLASNSCPQNCICSYGKVNTDTLEVQCKAQKLTQMPLELPYASAYRLVFAQNDITVLEPRAYLEKTVALDLSDNKLVNITSKAISQLKGHIKWLHLHQNQLSCLPEVTEEILVSVNEITLHDNSWNCTCLDTMLHQWMHDDYQQVLNTESLRCSESPDLPMHGIHEVPSNVHSGDNIQSGGQNNEIDVDNRKTWCPLPKVGSLSKRHGFFAFVMTLVSLGVIGGGLCVLYIYKYRLKQNEEPKEERTEADDKKAMLETV